ALSKSFPKKTVHSRKRNVAKSPKPLASAPSGTPISHKTEPAITSSNGKNFSVSTETPLRISSTPAHESTAFLQDSTRAKSQAKRKRALLKPKPKSPSPES